MAKKLAHFVMYALTSSKMTNFQSYFTVRISNLWKCQCLKSNSWKQDRIIISHCYVL